MKKDYERSTITGYIDFRGNYAEYGDTDHYQHRFVNFCRYPRTMQERRWNEAHNKFVRGRRKNLPTTWSDLPTSFSYGKCWKRFTKKRKQYL